MTKDTDNDRVERAATVTYPVASFTLKRSHIEWIAREAARLGVNKSEFLRRKIDRLIEEGEGKAA